MDALGPTAPTHKPHRVCPSGPRPSDSVAGRIGQALFGLKRNREKPAITAVHEVKGQPPDAKGAEQPGEQR